RRTGGSRIVSSMHVAVPLVVRLLCGSEACREGIPPENLCSATLAALLTLLSRRLADKFRSLRISPSPRLTPPLRSAYHDYHYLLAFCGRALGSEQRP